MWRSDNRLDGRTRRIQWDHGQPLLFRTRRECRAWIEEKFGYIRTRDDLKREPFGWKMPLAIKVEVRLVPV